MGGDDLTAVLALAVAFLTVLLPMRWGALSTLALAGVVAVASVGVFRAGTWVPLVPGLLGTRDRRASAAWRGSTSSRAATSGR